MIFDSWLNLIAKLTLLLICTVGLWSYKDKFAPKIQPFPIFSAACLPFFITYKIATALGKASILNGLYTAIALLGALAFLAIAFRHSGSWRDTYAQYTALFQQHRVLVGLLVSIFIFFSLRGLYLEYPGDSIYYLQRIGHANQDGPINISSLWSYIPSDTFFSSFQQWLTGHDYLLRAKLRPIAAVSASIFCLTIYRLTWWCTHHKTSSVLAVLLCLGFYGNLQISFFLYKILQGATLAIIIYVEVIPFLYEFLSERQIKQLMWSRRHVILILALATWGCLDNHKEKLFYLFAVALSYSFFALVKYGLAKKRPPFLLASIFLLISAFLIILFFSGKPPVENYYLPLIKTWFSFGEQTVYTYWPTATNSSLLLLDFLVIGLAILFLIIYRPYSKEFFMAAVAIAPFFIFINPIAITGLIKITSPNNLYRLVIGGLPWILLPMACHALQRDHSIKLKYLSVIFAFLGFFAFAPIYGKYPHLVKRVPDYADGQDLQPVIEHLLQTSDQSGNYLLKVMAPDYVVRYLYAWPRFIVSTPVLEITAFGNFDIVVDDCRSNLNYQSWLGGMTEHWPPDSVSRQQVCPRLTAYLENELQPFFEKTLEQNGFRVYQAIRP